MTDGPALRLSNVGLTFPRRRGIRALFGGRQSTDFVALEGIDLEVKRGEVLGVIGRNGSGKSTMLRVMAGVFSPDVGEAKASGRVSLLASLGTGFAGHLTGRENAMLYGSVLGRSREQMLDLMHGIIEFSERRKVPRPNWILFSGRLLLFVQPSCKIKLLDLSTVMEILSMLSIWNLRSIENDYSASVDQHEEILATNCVTN